MGTASSLLRLRLVLWQAPNWPLQYRLLLLLVMALLSTALGQQHLLKPLQQENARLAQRSLPQPPDSGDDEAASRSVHDRTPGGVAIEDWLRSSLGAHGLDVRALTMEAGGGDTEAVAVRLRAVGPRAGVAAFINEVASWQRRAVPVSLAVEHGEPGAARLETRLRVETGKAAVVGVHEGRNGGGWQAAMGGGDGMAGGSAADGGLGVAGEASGPWRLVGHLGHGERRGVVAAPDGRLLAVAEGEAMGESGWVVDRVGPDHLALRRFTVDGHTEWWRLGLEMEQAAP